MVNLLLNKDERAVVDIISSDKGTEKPLIKIPYNFMISNKVCYLFNEKKGLQINSKELDQIQKEVEETRLLIDEIRMLSNIFKENGIGFVMLSKTIETQCDGHEVDILIKENQIERARDIVEGLGYIDVPWGGAYAKKIGNVILHVDIYPEKDDDIIFDGGKKKREINGIYTLSPEYELSSRILKPILMRSTRISLCDILHISNLLEKYNIQHLPRNIKKSWITPCFHSIYLINTLYEALYSRDIKAPIVERAKKFHKCSRVWNFLSKKEAKKVNIPFHSFIFSYSCLIYKLLHDMYHFNFKDIVRSVIFFINHITVSISNTYVSVLSLLKIQKKKRIIICFTGMDGTGKTSHATKIVRTLKTMGIPCQYSWCNWLPRVSFPFMVLIYLVTCGYRRKDYHKSKILRKTWNYIVICDFLFIYLFRIKRYLLVGKNVVCDRYVYDMIADLMYDGIYSEEASNLLLRFVPKPDLVFMFDVPEGVSDLRKDDTKDSVNIKETDDAIDYLRVHRENYLKIAESSGISIIDTTKDFEGLHEQVFEQVCQTYIDKNKSKNR